MSGGRRRGLDVALPAALWLVAAGAAGAAGFRMSIPWWDWHLLDAQALRAHPLASLCYLHSQPPALNALLAAVLAAADATGLEPATVGAVVFGALGLLASVALYRTVVRLTGSAALAAAGLVLVVADPGHHVFANLFFYEFPIHVLLVLILAASVRWLAGGGRARLVPVVLLLALLALTRTLFHPVWAIGFFVTLVALRALRRPGGLAGQWGGVLRAAVLLAALLAAWPAKNAWVFGSFLYASMSAFSLTRVAPDCERPIASSRLAPEALAAAERRLGERAVAACGRDGAAALTTTTKSDGSANWNHVGWLAKVPAFEACAHDYFASHRDEVLDRAAGQYAMWTRASFVHPYVGTMIGPSAPGYEAYVQLWDDTLFANLRPAIEGRWPGWSVHRHARMRNGRPMPYTVFGVVVLPVLSLALAVAGLLRAREPGGATALLVLAIVVPPMIATCLTDGQEGNRMRFATMPILVVGLCWLVGLARRAR